MHTTEPANYGEPWYGKQARTICFDNDAAFCQVFEHIETPVGEIVLSPEALRDRIVACVNACVGVDLSNVTVEGTRARIEADPWVKAKVLQEKLQVLEAYSGTGASPRGQEPRAPHAGRGQARQSRAGVGALPEGR